MICIAGDVVILGSVRNSLKILETSINKLLNNKEVKMRIYLNVNQVGFTIESLDYTILAFNKYQDYPDEEFRKKRIAEAEKVRQIFRDARNKYNEIKKGGKNESKN